MKRLIPKTVVMDDGTEFEWKDFQKVFDHEGLKLLLRGTESSIHIARVSTVKKMMQKL